MPPNKKATKEAMEDGPPAPDAHSSGRHQANFSDPNAQPTTAGSQLNTFYPALQYPAMPNEGPAPYPYHAAAPPMYVPQYYQHPPGINPLMPMNVPLYSSMGAQVPLPQQVPAAYPYYPTAAPIPGAISPPDYGAQIGVHGEQRQPVVAWENSTVPNVNNANLYPAPIPVASSIPHDVSSPQIVMTMPQEGTTVSQVAISPAGAQDPAAEEQKPKEKKKFLYIAPPPPDFKPPCLLYILTWPFILVFVVVRSVLESTYRAVVGISKFTWNSILIPIAKAVLYIINIPYKYILRPLGKAIASCSKVICPCIPCGSCFAAIGQFFVGIGGFFVEIGKIFWFAIKSLVSSLGYVIWSLATMIVLIVYHVLEAFWEVFFESCHCILKPIGRACKAFFKAVWGTAYVIEAQLTGTRHKARKEQSASTVTNPVATAQESA